MAGKISLKKEKERKTALLDGLKDLVYNVDNYTKENIDSSVLLILNENLLNDGEVEGISDILEMDVYCVDAILEEKDPETENFIVRIYFFSTDEKAMESSKEIITEYSKINKVRKYSRAMLEYEAPTYSDLKGEVDYIMKNNLEEFASGIASRIYERDYDTLEEIFDCIYYENESIIW